MSMVLYIPCKGESLFVSTKRVSKQSVLIYTQRGLRHCLSSDGRQCESLICGMSDDFRFPRFFYVVLGWMFFCRNWGSPAENMFLYEKNHLFVVTHLIFGLFHLLWFPLFTFSILLPLTSSYPSSRIWSTGNKSLFIKPGYVIFKLFIK